jgi:uncharacterized iron-regulated protein
MSVDNATMPMCRLLRAAVLASAVALSSCAPLRTTQETPVAIPADATALARFMQGKRVVLLGEVHDNASQHALRLAALERVVALGARPALVFEQFDQDRQAAIDRARRERPGDVDYLIEQAKGSGGWHWASYRPMLALALAHRLPIVAGNLSRGDAMRVAKEGWAAVFDDGTRDALRLDALPADFLRKHEQAIAAGHCDRLPAASLAPIARAQIARDIALAQALRPYAPDGVVLIAGNGHVRRDIGVPFWLTPDERAAVVSIGLVERDDEPAQRPLPFDAVVVTAAAERADPCNGVTPARLPRVSPES